MDSVLREMELALADVDWELQLACERFISELDGAVQHLLRGDPERFPLLDLRTHESSGGDSYRIYVEQGGWYVVYQLEYSRYPGLEQAKAEVDLLQSRRRERIHDFFQTYRDRWEDS